MSKKQAAAIEVANTSLEDHFKQNRVSEGFDRILKLRYQLDNWQPLPNVVYLDAEKPPVEQLEQTQQIIDKLTAQLVAELDLKEDAILSFKGKFYQYPGFAEIPKPAALVINERLAKGLPAEIKTRSRKSNDVQNAD